MRKYSCSGPTVVFTMVTSSLPKRRSTRTAWRLMASIDRSSGVFLSSASPP